MFFCRGSKTASKRKNLELDMPEKDKETLAEICKSSKIKVEDLLQEFFRWIVRDKESAARWLQGKDEQKKV